MSDRYFGRIRSATADLADGRLLVRVTGVLPAPGLEVLLTVYPHGPESNADVELGLYWRGESEPEVEPGMPFIAHAAVAVPGTRTPTVRIYDASGYHDVEVRHAPPHPDLPAPDPPG